jgi:hypothetical protein
MKCPIGIHRVLVIALVAMLLLPSIGSTVRAQSTTVTATIDSASPVPIAGFNTDETVDIVATLNTSDPDENGEGEPLILQSSTGFSATVSVYALTTSFSFTASSPGTLSGFIAGADGDESATVTVTRNSTQKKRFTQAQKDTLAKASADLAIQTGVYTSVALACALVPDPSITKICAFGSGALAAVAGLASALFNRLALDPSDPNFTVIAQPVIPSLPLLVVQSGVMQPEADALNALLLNQEQVIGFTQAIITSINRAQGASDAGNAFWEAQQVQAANTYVGQLAFLLAAQPALMTNAQNALLTAGFPTVPISPATVFTVESDVLSNGLPVPLAQALTQLGADSAAIDQIRQLIIVQDINVVAGNFPQLMTRPQLISDLQQLAQSLVSFDVCLQDETNAGNFVLINTSTGAFSFFCSGSPVASGTGTLTTRGGIGSIEQNKGDRRLLIQWDTTAQGGKGAGTATLMKVGGKITCQITDRDMSNNTCTAPQTSAPERKPGKGQKPN